MAKVKIDGHIWYLAFNQYLNFLFCDNYTILFLDRANKYLTFKFQDQGK